jgi:hypothetical protein
MLRKIISSPYQFLYYCEYYNFERTNNIWYFGLRGLPILNQLSVIFGLAFYLSGYFHLSLISGIIQRNFSNDQLTVFCFIFTGALILINYLIYTRKKRKQLFYTKFESITRKQRIFGGIIISISMLSISFFLIFHSLYFYMTHK